MSWEVIEKSWSIDNLDNLIEKKARGSGLIKFLIKSFGQKGVYYGSIVVIFIFPLACFLI